MKLGGHGPRLLLAFSTAAALLGACADAPEGPVTDPPPVTVEAVEVEAASHDLRPGEQVQLTARAFDADGRLVTGRTFRWESDNATAAVVSDEGMVTAVAEGEVTIYASTGLVSGGVFLIVSEVEQPAVGWVDVHPSGHVEVEAGSTLQLTATVFGVNGEVLEGRTLTWSSSSTDVATVSATGLVIAVAAGDAWIAVECEGLIDEMVVRVPDLPVPVDHVTLDDVEISLPRGATTQLVAQPRDAQGQPLDRPVSWRSSDPARVSVGANGLVTAIDLGGADITATSEGTSATVRVNVTLTTEYTLTALNGRALPSALGSFTVTLPDGSTTTRSVRIYDGWLTIEHGSQTYEASIRGIYVTPASAVPLPIIYESRGTVTVSATGDLVFTPDEGRTFTGVPGAADLRIRWQLDERISGESSFLFAIE